MILNIEKARSNNKILVSRDQNCNRMIVGNISGRVLHWCDVSTAIERWGLIYQEDGKNKVVNKFRFSEML